MTITHILVDFENVQPSAADIALMRGDSLRLTIFRGPSQMKYSADVAEAWQPLGESVSFIRCAKAGRNAVDMHIAFYLGELVAAHAGGDPVRRARFVIVSRDTDFDPLLTYIRNEGYDATRVASIKAALGGHDAERAEPKAAKQRGTRAAKETKAPRAKKTAAKKQAVKNAAAASPAKAKASTAERGAAKKIAPADARTKIIGLLQALGEKRPRKRKGLERHIESHVGRHLPPGGVDALIEELERDEVLVFDDNKVTYRLPTAKK